MCRMEGKKKIKQTFFASDGFLLAEISFTSLGICLQRDMHNISKSILTAVIFRQWKFEAAANGYPWV